MQITQKEDEFQFTETDGTATLSGRDSEFRESTVRRDQLVRSEDHREDFQGNSAKSQPTDETKDDVEARNDYVELRVQLYVPKEETLPLLLKYIDLTRTTHTILDVLQESRIDDHWNVNVDRNLSVSWTGFTKFTQLCDKLPKGYVWLRRRLTKIQATPDLIICGLKLWSGMSKAAQKKEKHPSMLGNCEAPRRREVCGRNGVRSNKSIFIFGFFQQVCESSGFSGHGLDPYTTNMTFEYAIHTL